MRYVAPLNVRSHDSEHFPRIVVALQGVKVASVHCGSRHTIALPEDRAVASSPATFTTGRDFSTPATTAPAAALYSWGWGAYGQLGLGDRVSQVRGCASMLQAPGAVFQVVLLSFLLG